MEEKDIEITDPVEKNIAILKRLKKAYSIAKEYDYVPQNTIDNVDHISKYIGVFEICILEKFSGCSPDDIINEIMIVIDKF